MILPTFAADKNKEENIPESIKHFQMSHLTTEKKASIFAEFVQFRLFFLLHS